jgi:ribosomal protein L29
MADNYERQVSQLKEEIIKLKEELTASRVIVAT